MKRPKLPVVRIGVITNMTPSQTEIIHSMVDDRGVNLWGYSHRVITAVYDAGLVESVSIGKLNTPNYVRLKAYWTYREIATLKAALTR